MYELVLEARLKHTWNSRQQKKAIYSLIPTYKCNPYIEPQSKGHINVDWRRQGHFLEMSIEGLGELYSEITRENA